MTTNVQAQSATIYDFVKARARAEARGQGQAVKGLEPQLAVGRFGGAHYHEAAIANAAEDRRPD